MKHLSILTLSLVIGLAGAPLTALASGDHGGAHSSPSNAEPTSSAQVVSDAAMTSGEIRKVNKETEKITIKHEELKNLGMPAMTMIFRVKDKSMLDQVKAGDKVNFVAEKIGGNFTVVQIEVSK